MYSTGNCQYSQYFKITYNRRESAKYIYRECVCTYISCFAVHLKWTQHCKSITLQLKRKKEEINLEFVPSKNIFQKQSVFEGGNFDFLRKSWKNWSPTDPHYQIIVIS